jgi:hypothetical protein
MLIYFLLAFATRDYGAPRELTQHHYACSR